jgi:hypothetical protein
MFVRPVEWREGGEHQDKVRPEQLSGRANSQNQSSYRNLSSLSVAFTNTSTLAHLPLTSLSLPSSIALPDAYRFLSHPLSYCSSRYLSAISTVATVKPSLSVFGLKVPLK